MSVIIIFSLYRCITPLLQFGADINLADQSGATPLYIAASNGHLECCRALLKCNARIDTISAVRIRSLVLYRNILVFYPSAKLPKGIVVVCLHKMSIRMSAHMSMLVRMMTYNNSSIFRALIS